MLLLSNLANMESPRRYPLFIQSLVFLSPIPLNLDFPIHITDLHVLIVCLTKSTHQYNDLSCTSHSHNHSLRDATKPHLPVTWCSVSLLPAFLCLESLKFCLHSAGTHQLHNLARKSKSKYVNLLDLWSLLKTQLSAHLLSWAWSTDSPTLKLPSVLLSTWQMTHVCLREHMYWLCKSLLFPGQLHKHHQPPQVCSSSPRPHISAFEMVPCWIYYQGTSV